MDKWITNWVYINSVLIAVDITCGVPSVPTDARQEDTGQHLKEMLSRIPSRCSQTRMKSSIVKLSKWWWQAQLTCGMYCTVQYSPFLSVLAIVTSTNTQYLGTEYITMSHHPSIGNSRDIQDDFS